MSRVFSVALAVSLREVSETSKWFKSGGIEEQEILRWMARFLRMMKRRVPAPNKMLGKLPIFLVCMKYIP